MISDKVEQLVERVADRLVPERMALDAVDLNDLAASLGAAKVIYRFARVHGFTEWTRWGPVVVTSMARTDGRRRSTLAHECAHLLFDPVLAPAGLALWGKENVDLFRRRSEYLLGDDLRSIALLAISEGVETLCDRLSFEMLFPRRRALTYADELLGLDKLREISARNRVSLAVIIMALNRLDSNLSLLRLARTVDGAWLIADAVSPRNTWRLGQTLTEQAALQLDAVAPGAFKAQTVSLSVGRGSHAIPAEVQRGATTALALLSSDAKHPASWSPAQSTLAYTCSSAPAPEQKHAV